MEQGKARLKEPRAELVQSWLVKLVYMGKVHGCPKGGQGGLCLGQQKVVAFFAKYNPFGVLGLIICFYPPLLEILSYPGKTSADAHGKVCLS